VRRFLGYLVGEDIVLDGLDDDPPERWSFRDITQDWSAGPGRYPTMTRQTWRLDER
jgi:hypothetical protein